MEPTLLIITLIKIALLYFAVINTVPIMSWVERRGAALIQDRPGPNRVGPLGLFQPIADAIKFMWKEDPIPQSANRFLYALAPFMGLIPASLVVASLPMGDFLEIAGHKIFLQISDLNVGLLYFLGVGSLAVYGILFGGWASNNKYSLLGAMRSASQVVSYELPLGLAATGAVMVYGTLSLREMVFAQSGTVFGIFPNWGLFHQPLGFLLFFISSFAETNRIPFDLPESEAELVAGFHTEYGSMKFATFMMTEYMNLTSMSALMVTLYFGGWQLPWISDATLLGWVGSRNLLGLLQFIIFFTKVSIFLLIYVWVRWTIPRFRFDQLMALSWKRLIPWGILNLIATAMMMYWMQGK